MVPKVKAALSALAWDDAEAIIADGSRRDALAARARRPDASARASAPAPARARRDRGAACSPSATGTRRSGGSSAARPIGSQGELVGAPVRPRLRGDPGDGQPRHRGARPRQGHARRPLGLRAPGGPRHGARPPSDERLRRILADIPVTVGPERPDPRPQRPAGHGQRHRPGDRRVHAQRAGGHGGRRQHAHRAVPRRAQPSTAGSTRFDTLTGAGRARRDVLTEALAR